MKEAMWGIGLIMLSVIAFVVVGTLSNVTTTNQQDYEYMKSTVESAMYDSIDEVRYRRGICVCTKNPKVDAKGAIVFDSTNQYEVLDPNEDSECDGIVKGSKKYEKNECRYMHGEYVVNPDTFTESLISRFGTVAKNQEEYDITVQDVISYPPKASVRVSYNQYFSSAISDETKRPIVNQMDAILEGGIESAERVKDRRMVSFVIKDCSDAIVHSGVTINIVDIADGKTYTAKNGGSAIELQAGSYKMSYGSYSDTFTVDKNDSNITVVLRTVKNLQDCPCSTSKTPTPDTDPIPEPEAGEFTVTTHHYLEGKTVKVHNDDVQNVKEGETYTTSQYDTTNLFDNYKNKYEWNKSKPTNASGKITKNVEVIYYYKLKATETRQSTGTCKWHYKNTSTTCKSTNPYDSKSESGVNVVCPSGYTESNVKCDAGNGIYYTTMSILNLKPRVIKNCTWTCKKGWSNKTFKTSSLTAKAQSSSPGSYNTKSEASSACARAQKEFCDAQSGYNNYTTHSCQAVQNWKCYDNGGEKGARREKTMYDQTSKPSCSKAGLNSNCSCYCLG